MYHLLKCYHFILNLLLLDVSFVSISRISIKTLWTFLSSANLISVSWLSSCRNISDLISNEEFKPVNLPVLAFWCLSSVRVDKVLASTITRNPETRERHMMNALGYLRKLDVLVYILLIRHCCSCRLACCNQGRILTTDQL